jgi:GntR family transcriptional regulator
MSYLTLSQRLEEQLAAASPGDLVPSENELAKLHKVNRLTARAALQELERRHLVRRIQGRGTFVARRLEYRISTEGPASFTEIVRRAGGNPSTTTDHVLVRAGTPAERRSLALAPRAHVVELSRTRWLDEEPVGVGKSVLPAALVPDLQQKLQGDGSLYRALEEEYDLSPRRAWFRCEVATAPEAVAARLKLRGRPDLFYNCGRLESERLRIPIEINDGWLRTDMFNVVIEVGDFQWKRS